METPPREAGQWRDQLLPSFRASFQGVQRHPDLCCPSRGPRDHSPGFAVTLTRFKAVWTWLLVASITTSLRGQEVGLGGGGDTCTCCGTGLACSLEVRGPLVQLWALEQRAAHSGCRGLLQRTFSRQLLKYSAHCHRVRQGQKSKGGLRGVRSDNGCGVVPHAFSPRGWRFVAQSFWRGGRTSLCPLQSLDIQDGQSSHCPGQESTLKSWQAGRGLLRA